MEQLHQTVSDGNFWQSFTGWNLISWTVALNSAVSSLENDMGRTTRRCFNSTTARTSPLQDVVDSAKLYSHCVFNMHICLALGCSAFPSCSSVLVPPVVCASSDVGEGHRARQAAGQDAREPHVRLHGAQPPAGETPPLQTAGCDVTEGRSQAVTRTQFNDNDGNDHNEGDCFCRCD